MAGNKFEDIQAQFQNQMSNNNNGDKEKRGLDSLHNATEDLKQVYHQVMMQNQMLAQSIQQQSMSIQQLANSVQSRSAMGGMGAGGMRPPPPPRPIQSGVPGGGFAGGMDAVMDAAVAGTGMAANMAIARLQQAQQASQSFRGQFSNQYGVPGAHPGQLTIPYNGIMSTMMNSTGLGYNPAAAASYTYGAYQRAQSTNVGIGTQNTLYGLASMGLGMGSFSTLGGLAGGALGSYLAPLPFNAGGIIGGMVGSKIGGALDFANPLAMASEQADKMFAFGNNAAQNSNIFLRGGGSGRGMGNFSLLDQAKIGSSMGRDFMMDQTFQNSQIMDMQDSFTMSGLMTGVQNPQQYSRKMKELVGSARYIMQTLQQTTSEATGLMDQMYNQMGAGGSAQMAKMTSRVYSAAMMSGLAPSQVAEIMTQGAQNASNSGLMASFGAQNAGFSVGLAGKSAGKLGANLMATIGGEKGLSSMISQANNQFMSGYGGTLMSLGGNFGSNIQGGLTNATSAIKGSGDIVSFMANRHSRVSEISPEEATMQQFSMLSGIADQLSAVGGSKRDRMMMAAQSVMGLGGAEAEAFIKAGESLPETMRTQMLANNQQQNDYNMGLMAEQNGVKGRARRAWRKHFMGDQSWVMPLSEAINTKSAYYSDIAGDKFQQISDFMIGVEGRGYYQGAERIMNDISEGGHHAFGNITGSSKSKEAIYGMSGYSESQKELVKDYMERALGNETIDDVLSDVPSVLGSALTGRTYDRGKEIGVNGYSQKLSKEKRINAIKNMAGKIKGGDYISSWNVAVTTSGFDNSNAASISNQEAFDILQASGLSGHALNQARSDLGLSDGEKISGYISQDERGKKFKKMFGDGFAIQDIDAALGDKNFESFTIGVSELHKIFDPQKQRQSEEYNKKEGEVIYAYESMSPKAKAVADRWMLKKGIKIENGRIVFVDRYENKGGGLLNDQEAEAGDIFFNSRNSLDSEQVQMAIGSGIEAISGRKISLEKGVGVGDQIGIVTDALGGVAQAKLEKIVTDKSNPISMRRAAAFELKRRSGGLSADETSRMLNSLTEIGLGGTEGENIRGFDKLDRTGVGGNEGSRIQRDSLVHLVELAKIVEGMNKK